MPLSSNIENQLRNAAHINTQITLFVSSSDLVKVIASTRNIILNWALKLEEDGILGNELCFTSEEKSVATKTEYNINNFFGTVEHSQFQLQTKDSLQIKTDISLDFKLIEKLLNEIKKNIEELGLMEKKWLLFR